ncbi:MAG TPA: hypothetical protein VFR55_05085 [Dehalococcoidia bacterium]|nr:hypothetical protein [Dehalococcoidia bacterium]
MVLAHPEIPLHNNSAELGARQRVRKRKISFGPRVADGAKAWDTFMSLAATTRKLGVNFYRYIQDRVSGANQVPQLSNIIEDRAKELNLGASWEAARFLPTFHETRVHAKARPISGLYLLLQQTQRAPAV